MAGEEDVELRDLIAHTLESRGVLGRIRAQLRASVFLALEEQESQQKPHPLENFKFQQYLKTKDGQIATALVREFLSFFELDYTCSVFDPETNALELCPGRSQLARTLGLDDSTASGPLLDFMLQRTTTTTHQPPNVIVSLTSLPRNPDESVANSDVSMGFHESVQSIATTASVDSSGKPAAVGHVEFDLPETAIRGDQVAGSDHASSTATSKEDATSQPGDQDQVNGNNDDLEQLEDKHTSSFGSAKNSAGTGKSSSSYFKVPRIENQVEETEDFTLSEGSLETSDYDYVESANS